MATSRKAEMQVVGHSEGIPRQRNRAVQKYRSVSWMFAGEAVRQSLTTDASIDASPQIVWKELLFFEEVAAHAPFLLRSLLPRPIRTEGEKKRLGATVRCLYSDGHLLKRITRVDAPNLLRFEVVTQRLGIEDCVRTRAGSYHIQKCNDGSNISLTTEYEVYLHPRILWRPLEVVLVSQLHRQILRGVSAAVASRRSGDALDDTGIMFT